MSGKATSSKPKLDHIDAHGEMLYAEMMKSRAYVKNLERVIRIGEVQERDVITKLSERRELAIQSMKKYYEHIDACELK